MTELFVPADSRLLGKSLREARLSDDTIQVLQSGEGRGRVRQSGAGDAPRRAGDRVVVHSRSSAVMALRSTDLVGLQAQPQAAGHDLETLRRRDVVMVEAIVGQTSRYVLRPIRDLDLLTRYGIHLIAVHRRDASFSQMATIFNCR